MNVEGNPERTLLPFNIQHSLLDIRYSVLFSLMQAAYGPLWRTYSSNRSMIWFSRVR
jgi:hypothetical protein